MDPLVLGLAALSAVCFLAFALWPRSSPRGQLEVVYAADDGAPKTQSWKVRSPLCLRLTPRPWWTAHQRRVNGDRLPMPDDIALLLNGNPMLFKEHMPMISETEILTVLHELSAAFNAHDIDRVMSFFAPDCSLDMPRGAESYGARFQGIEHVTKGLLWRFGSTPDVHYSDLEHFASGNCGMSRWLLTGTKLNGEKVRVNGCDIYTFRDGFVIRKDSYWKIVE